ncbi:DUF4064 domain-containing protein [Bhargavaea ullalensis]|uniref:DUF4064 domain-containing protein n=1 Tax=Bhargavaea ullalensis TaxID=1265685 RepID=A0ABV2GDE9_9BACL
MQYEQTAYGRPFKRTGEMVLGIIGIVFNVLGIIGVFLLNGFTKMISSDPAFREEFEAEIWNDPTLSQSEAQSIIDIMYSVIDWMVGFGWFFIVALIISTILGVFAVVNLKKNSKLAGILFLVAGFLAGILTLTSILLYIAGIMCLVRKPPVAPQEPSSYSDDDFGEPMRPL